MVIITIFVIIIFCILAYFSIRSNRVYKERIKILAKIFTLNTQDIDNGKGYDGWRYREFSKISYNRMWLTFWKPIKSFYKNVNLLK